MKETIEAAKKILPQEQPHYANCSMLSYSLRTDTLLHVPVQPVTVLNALCSYATFTLLPKSWSKQKLQRNGGVILFILPPAFSPTATTAYTKYSHFNLCMPRQWIPQPHSGAEFCLNFITR